MAIPIIGENFLEEKSTSESIATLIFPQLRATVVVEDRPPGLKQYWHKTKRGLYGGRFQVPSATGE
jgi:hypothetical protein